MCVCVSEYAYTHTGRGGISSLQSWKMWGKMLNQLGPNWRVLLSAFQCRCLWLVFTVYLYKVVLGYPRKGCSIRLAHAYSLLILMTVSSLELFSTFSHFSVSQHVSSKPPLWLCLMWQITCALQKKNLPPPWGQFVEHMYYCSKVL